MLVMTSADHRNSTSDEKKGKKRKKRRKGKPQNGTSYCVLWYCVHRQQEQQLFTTSIYGLTSQRQFTTSVRLLSTTASGRSDDTRQIRGKERRENEKRMNNSQHDTDSVPLSLSLL